MRVVLGWSRQTFCVGRMEKVVGNWECMAARRDFKMNGGVRCLVGQQERRECLSKR